MNKMKTKLFVDVKTELNFNSLYTEIIFEITHTHYEIIQVCDQTKVLLKLYRRVKKFIVLLL